MIVDEGIVLVKIWLEVGRAEQLKRFLDREQDPLKQWKLSARSTSTGWRNGTTTTKAIDETMARSHAARTPWTVIRSDDKKRARIAAIQTILLAVDFKGEGRRCHRHARSAICGGPDLAEGLT